MKKCLYRKISLLLLLLFSISCSEETNVSIIPNPNYLKIQNGFFLFDNNTRLEYNINNNAIEKLVQGFVNRIKLSTGLNLKANEKTNNKIIFKILADSNTGKEKYDITVAEDSVLICGSSEAGLFYGLQSFYQLLGPQIFNNDKKLNLPIKIPKLIISDSPKFNYRGAMLDVGRHFASKEFVKKFIDILAFHKLNKFHWHLTEDQGWRIEIKKYPKLTEIGSIRKETLNNGIKHEGFYTQNDIREIVKYASERYIEIIPEIEMPGHSQAAIAAYPQLSCTQNKFEVSTQFGVHENIYCAGKENTFEFLQNTLDEIIELFPSKYIHIGGDEAPKIRWSKCQNCQRRIKDENLKDESELQSYFIKRIENYLSDKGKFIIGWDEILEGGLAPNATVMSWRGIEGGIKAAKEGHDVIMSPNTYCYFDYYQALHNEPYAIGGFTSLEKVYSYNPFPHELSKEESKHILGVQANLWTEYISSFEYAEYMILPRFSALAEICWTNVENQNYSDFSRRMIDQYARYGYLNWNYRVPTPIGLSSQKIISQQESIILENPIPGSIVKYTLDGTEPDINSKTYSQPILIDKSTTIKAKTLMPDGKLGRVVISAISLIDTAINGLNYSYYEGNWSKLPNFDDENAIKSGSTTRINLGSIVTRQDHFAIVYNSKIIIEEEGEYKFYLTSDDGSRLLINNELIIDNDGSHSKRELFSTIKLTKGIHDFRLEYFEDYEGEFLDIMIEGPNLTRQEIPASMLLLNKSK